MGCPKSAPRFEDLLRHQVRVGRCGRASLPLTAVDGRRAGLLGCGLFVVVLRLVHRLVLLLLLLLLVLPLPLLLLLLGRLRLLLRLHLRRAPIAPSIVVAVACLRLLPCLLRRSLPARPASSVVLLLPTRILPGRRPRTPALILVVLDLAGLLGLALPLAAAAAPALPPAAGPVLLPALALLLRGRPRRQRRQLGLPLPLGLCLGLADGQRTLEEARHPWNAFIRLRPSRDRPCSHRRLRLRFG
mmetsp:Transcript_46728/g.139497  ORF Transcript_46728/g.139497 Transcript_46728/m.139497 type:complete len:244 (+) Transcript_46728:275-1006(+)